MATRKQKQDLMSALKFTPRDIEITLSGYGGELVLGRISEAAYDYWEGRDDLSDFVYDWDGEFEDMPADARFVTDGAWHDVDDICHESGCEASDACWITVEDRLESKTLFESNLDLDNLADKGIDTSNHSHSRPNETEPDGTCVFLGQSFEKGTFFSGTIRITQPFDPRKLSISWHDCDGWRLITGVEYDGEEVDGYGAYSTTGKGSEYQVYRVERDDTPDNDCSSERWDPAQELAKIPVPSEFTCVQCDWQGTADELVYPDDKADGVCPSCDSPVEIIDSLDIPILEGEETWASRVIDESRLSPWWPSDTKPVRKGMYEVEYATGAWPFPITAQVEWTGKKWRHERSGDQTVKQWRGLNYNPN